MSRAWPPGRRLLGSLAGRLSLILILGVVGASLVSLLIAEHARVRDYDHARWQRVVDSTADIVARLTRDPVGTNALLQNGRIFGAHQAPPLWRDARPQPELTAMLAALLGTRAAVMAMTAPSATCFPSLHFASRAAGMPAEALPSCSFVRFTDANGLSRSLSIDVAPSTMPRSSILDPRYLLPLLLAGIGLAFIAARLVTAPLRRLTQAATAFSVTLDPEPIPERGPREIHAALVTFNVMQRRVREGFRERTHLLASITHDLQTPLTRMRLRVEHVADAAIREKLIADLTAMQGLVRGGLELARSSESRETWIMADVDSVLSSVAEDALEMGHDVRFTQGSGAQARVKVDALIRCLNNLVDNAIKYAGSAEVGSEIDGDDLIISVRDHGPGLDDEAIRLAVEPFNRLAVQKKGTGSGTGLGLAIARAQALTFGATLSIRRHEGGGLIATIRMSKSET